MLTISQGTRSLWLPHTALRVLLTPQPNTIIIQCMGKNLQVVQGWPTSAFTTCYPVVCISLGTSPPSCSHRAGSTHAPHRRSLAPKCISTWDFFFKDSVKEPASMYCSAKNSGLKFCYEEESMVYSKHCFQRCSLLSYFNDSKKLGVLSESLIKYKSTLTNYGF